MVDVFAVLVLVGVIGAVIIRKVQRPARFEGSHLGEADLILALIAGIVTTLLLWHASRIALGLNEWPASWSPVSDASVRPLRRRRRHRGPRARLRVGARADHPQLPRLPAALQAPAHRDRGVQRLLHSHARTRATRAAPLRRARGGDALRRRHGGRPHLEADTRHLLLHRVRALPGRLPRLDHRQGAVAEAADHGPARPGLRGGAQADPRRGRLRALAARAERGDRQRGLGLRDLRGVRARVPGVDRARRSHHRPAPPPRDDGFLASRPSPSRCCATWSAPRIRGASRRRSAPTGPQSSACACSSRATRHRRCSTGWAAPRRSTSAPARPRSPRPSCSRRPAWTSPSSARASRAPATPRAGWATSTCSRRTPSRTSGR